MRRPTLLNHPSLPSGGDGDTLDGQSSPPATWEDRVDSDFDSSANWMDTGEPPSHSCTGARSTMQAAYGWCLLPVCPVYMSTWQLADVHLCASRRSG